jgi:hypothetical protein
MNVTISQNLYGIACRHNSNPLLMNVTISQNLEGILCIANSNPTLINTIIWSDTLQKITIHEWEWGEAISITLAYSDIQGGRDSIVTNRKESIHWLDGNIDIDPQFVNPFQGDFRLLAGSPCIDAGIQDTFLIYNNNLDTLFIPAFEFLGSAPDIGAFEFDPLPIEEKKPCNPTCFALHQNYPNPFNPRTMIEFTLPTSSFVTLKVYDLLGKEITTLIAEKQSAGIHKFSWIAENLAGGVYFYRLNTDKGFTQTRKLILLK